MLDHVLEEGESSVHPVDFVGHSKVLSENFVGCDYCFDFGTHFLPGISVVYGDYFVYDHYFLLGKSVGSDCFVHYYLPGKSKGSEPCAYPVNID